MAADCGDKIRGVGVFIKFYNLHHLAFPNGSCKHGVTLKG